jgi:hypothetical protein
MATQGDKNKASLVRNVDANPSSIVKFKKFPKCFLPWNIEQIFLKLVWNNWDAKDTQNTEQMSDLYTYRELEYLSCSS